MSTPALRASRGSRAAQALVGLGLVFLLAHAAAKGGAAEDRVRAARLDAGADPQRALGTLRALRAEALAQGRIDLRLQVDEAECRILSDIDATQAVAVADAGLAAAGPDPVPPSREPWLRMRACRAGMLVELGETAAGRAEFETLLALSAALEDAGPGALVRMERGVQRSRNGDWDAAQKDLIAACEQLKAPPPAPDHSLCLGHLANHYRRVGDVDESLRLLQSLYAEARQRSALYDSAIYGFGIGQAQQSRQRWEEAIRSFEEAAEASRQLGDRLGVSYADHAIAVSHLRLGRPREALAWADRALGPLDRGADPRQYETNLVTRAEALNLLGRPEEALAALDAVGAAVRKRGDEPALALWYGVHAKVLHALGRWREAYEALETTHAMQGKLQELRVSQQAARLRMQFNRQRDEEDISALRLLNEQGQRLRETQAVALVLFVLLLAAVLLVVARKIGQARHLQTLASTDELTGLANRRALMAFAADALQKAERTQAPLAVLMIDIDHFKRINDGHGHATGDAVLRHAARVLAGGLRERDRLGRVGGEEFVAVLPGATLEQAGQVAERMRGAIAAAPLAGPAGGLRFTVSIGVAGGRTAESAARLLERADAALYRAKGGGRNAVVVEPIEAAPAHAG